MLATIRSNRLFTFLLNFERAALDHLHLPLLNRLFHKKTRRHFAAVLIGAIICLVGSFMAEHKAEMAHYMPMCVWDALSYSVHGIGLGPIVTRIEPIWRIFMGD